MGMVRVKRLVLVASVSLLMAPAAQAGLLSKWDELTVKGGELESCPGVTLEQQADSFFKDPDWSAGTAADGRKLVNVSGTFTYMERPVRGMLQMWVQGEGFSVEALEINGQPQPEIMIDALLDKMCEAAKEEAAPQTAQRGKQPLPFIGKRSFNFAGGSGTEQYITIQQNGKTVIESCGASLMDDNGNFQDPSCSVDWTGTFATPLKTSSAMYRIEKDRIYQIEPDGSPAKDCLASREDCSVSLYE
ncbi:hypothetical protein [Aeromonas veronii]|uniref:hypothetical protein n=1 Tax=Aeromonas veronii TaxID=654 RepID=UPI001F39E553|nr:hypothetical protein [Aeromonas veronii]MCF5888243.1 hypothetical protein [Aeromonas veronii]